VPLKTRSTALALTSDLTPLQSTLTKDKRMIEEPPTSIIKSFEIYEKKISTNNEEDKKLEVDTDKNEDSTGGECPNNLS